MGSWRPDAISEALGRLPKELQLEALQAIADHANSPEYKAEQARMAGVTRRLARGVAENIDRMMFEVLTGRPIAPELQPATSQRLVPTLQRLT